MPLVVASFAVRKSFTLHLNSKLIGASCVATTSRCKRALNETIPLSIEHQIFLSDMTQ